MSDTVEEAVLGWDDGEWLNPPVEASTDGLGALLVEAAEGSDAWRKTSYGFVRDNAHCLMRPFGLGSAVEVGLVANMSAQFDQAGLIVRLDSDRWIKAGLEFADGMLQLSTVVTDDHSDWSTAPVPHWAGRHATVRASWDDGAITIRARIQDQPFELARLAPWNPAADSPVAAGPYFCAPTRAGFRAEFLRWAVGPCDSALH